VRRGRPTAAQFPARNGAGTCYCGFGRADTCGSGRQATGLNSAARVQVVMFTESWCVQTMHHGSYDHEPETLARMHGFMAEQGLVNNGLHHENLSVRCGRNRHREDTHHPAPTRSGRLIGPFPRNGHYKPLTCAKGHFRELGIRDLLSPMTSGRRSGPDTVETTGPACIVCRRRALCRCRCDAR
jgi:GyrI-like small molecule binding domain